MYDPFLMYYALWSSCILTPQHSLTGLMGQQYAPTLLELESPGRAVSQQTKQKRTYCGKNSGFQK